MFDKLGDAARLLMAGHKDLSQLRRDTLRPALNRNFRSVCDLSLNNNPTSNEFLLGDDLSKRVEDIGKSKKITNQILVSKNEAQRGRPFPRGRPPFHHNPSPKGKGFNQSGSNNLNKKRQRDFAGPHQSAKFPRRE